MSSHQKYLLIIDDAPADSQLIDYFAQFDYQIVQHTMLSHIGQEIAAPAALLINAALIDIDLASITILYHRFSIPILVISECDDEEMCVRILEAGADDFLIKPLHPRELHARIGAISRRVQRSIKEIDSEKDVLLFANWRLYPASRQLFNDQKQELLLSAGEYALLLAFIRQPQHVLSREFLLQITKSSELNPFDRRIDVQISRLRQKIELDAKKPTLIKTIRNRGYLFTAAVLSIKEEN